MNKFQKYQFERPSFMNKPNYKSIGYALLGQRVQERDTQVADLKEEGCCLVFQERISPIIKNKERPVLVSALEELNAGDELVISKISYLGRSYFEVINRIKDLQQKGIHIRTLDGGIKTRDLGEFAPFIIGILSGLASVEQTLTREKKLERIQHRLETGKSIGGRPKTNKAKESLVLRLRDEGYSYRSIREQTGLALSTIRRIIVEKETLIMST